MLSRPGPAPIPTRTSVDAWVGTEPGGERGARQAVIDPLAVMMQDLLTQNYALRRENQELMDQVQRQLCENAYLLAQVRPPACRVTFPETFKDDCAWLSRFWIQATFEATFSIDTLKVAFLISCFSEVAEEFVVPYIERESPILCHYEDFVDTLGPSSVRRDGCKPLRPPQTRACLALIH